MRMRRDRRRPVVLGLALAMVLGIFMYSRLWVMDYRIASDEADLLRKQFDLASREAMDESAEWRFKYDQEVEKASKCAKELNEEIRNLILSLGPYTFNSPFISWVASRKSVSTTRVVLVPSSTVSLHAHNPSPLSMYHIVLLRKQFDLASREAMDEFAEWRFKYDQEVEKASKCVKELNEIKGSLEKNPHDATEDNKKLRLLQKENMGLVEQVQSLKQELEAEKLKCKAR